MATKEGKRTTFGHRTLVRAIANVIEDVSVETPIMSERLICKKRDLVGPHKPDMIDHRTTVGTFQGFLASMGPNVRCQMRFHHECFACIKGKEQ